jgi:hypothetical protein
MQTAETIVRERDLTPIAEFADLVVIGDLFRGRAGPRRAPGSARPQAERGTGAH